MKRLKRQQGFTMVEMLVCVLLLLLISVMCSTGIGLAMQSYQASVYEADSQMLESTLNASLGDMLRHAGKVLPAEGGPVTGFSNTNQKIRGGRLEVKPLTETNGGMLLLYKNAKPDCEPLLVISSKIYGDDLYIEDFELSFDKTTKIFSGKYTIKSRAISGVEKECEFAYRSIAE